MENVQHCTHSAQSWYTTTHCQIETIRCHDCDSEGLTEEERNNPNIIFHKGDKLELLGPSGNEGPGRNPRCCNKARRAKGLYFCVCLYRSYCPDHGVQCNGSHD